MMLFSAIRLKELVLTTERASRLEMSDAAKATQEALPDQNAVVTVDMHALTEEVYAQQVAVQMKLDEENKCAAVAKAKLKKAAEGTNSRLPAPELTEEESAQL